MAFTDIGGAEGARGMFLTGSAAPEYFMRSGWAAQFIGELRRGRLTMQCRGTRG